MLRAPTPSLAPADEKSRILDLEERVLRFDLRIASLESRVRHDDRIIDGRLHRHQEEIESLKVAVSRMNAENTALLAEQAELASRIAILDERQAQQAASTPSPDALQGQQRRLNSLAGEVEQLKSGVAANRILPGRLFVPGTDPFVGIINHLTRECGGNVADIGIVVITAASVAQNHFPRNAADFHSGKIFQSKDRLNQWIEWDFKDA
jgi:hypothetical protein